MPTLASATINDSNGVSNNSTTSSTSTSRLHPTYFIGHAGVSLLFRDDLGPVQDNLRKIGQEILALQPRPKAIIALSGHFEAGEIHGPGVIEVNVKRMSHIQHDFVNDFHDSHPFVYDYDWEHRDAPELAKEVWRHLISSGIKSKRTERGVDHGIWVPFKLMFPEESPLDVPLIQVSTYHGYNLASQIALGEALRPLREEGYLILGSGMAVHSFESMGEIWRLPEGAERVAKEQQVLQESRSFDTAIKAALNSKDHASYEERVNALLALENLPEFKRSHPTVEHFTPLLVAAGAAGESHAEPAGEEFVEAGMSYSNFRFTPVVA